MLAMIMAVAVGVPLLSVWGFYRYLKRFEESTGMGV